jgi:hypothetical protein
MSIRRDKLAQLAEPAPISPPFRDLIADRLHPAQRTNAVAATWSWGWLPALSLACACGLLLVAIGFSRSTVGADWAEPLFWAGLLVGIVPVTLRLIAAAPPRHERIGLVILLGLTFYLVKVLYSPFAFTFPDEMKQIYNVSMILETRHLFHNNFALPATPLYPGLSTVVSALASVSGLSVFAAGLIMMGAARLVLILALYLLHEQVSGSARVAGIAAVIYMGNPNFLYYIAEFSYEALALPLATMALFLLARRDREPGSSGRVGMTLAALLGMGAVVITHHMTSYALVGFLSAVSLVQRVLARNRQRGIGGFALIALVATLTWFAFIATLTVDYLAPVFGRAVTSLIGTIAREETGRELFRSGSEYVSPLWERVTALGSVLLLLAGMPFGLVQIWRRHRRSPFVLVLAAGALAYFGMLMLRFIPAAWETSNRSSEFLFVGISLVVAFGIAQSRIPHFGGSIGRMEQVVVARRLVWPMHGLLAGCIAVIFMGGVIAGWSPGLRLARPYLIDGGGYGVEPQGVTAAKWVRAYLGPDNRIAAGKSNGELLLAYGEQEALSGNLYGIDPMMLSPLVDRSVLQILQHTSTQYVLVDQRRVSRESMKGIFWSRMTDATQRDTALFAPNVYTKFDRPKQVSRIFDSGNITIYDVRVLSAITSTE